VFWSDYQSIIDESLGGLSSLTGIPFFNNAFQYLTNKGISTNVMNFHLLDDTTASRLGGIIIPKIEANSFVTVPLYIMPNSLALNGRTLVASLPLLYSNASNLNISQNGNHDYSRFLKFGIERALNITIDTAQFNTCYKTAFDTLLSVVGSNATTGLFISFNAGISAMLTKISSAACVSNIPTSLNNTQFQSILRETIGTLAWGDSTVSNTFRTANGTNVPSSAFTREGYSGGGGDVDEFCDIVREDFTPSVEDIHDFIKAIEEGDKDYVPYAVTAPSIAAAHLLCMLGSADPNQKYGPGNNPDKIWLNTKNDKGYTIEFENVPSASAPAQTVVITDTLDASKIDLASFRWGSITVSNNIFIDLSDIVDTTVIKVINLQPAMNNKLLIVAQYSPTTGIAEWKFFTTDLINIQPTTNPFEGFLPPNTSGQGVGSVSYKVNYKPSVILGDYITNKATIVFDENAPIITNTWTNRYDDVKPQSAVTSLPPVVADTFQVSWSGSDAVSGIFRYAVFVSDNDDAYELWKFTDSTSIEFVGVSGHKYEFYSIAMDQAGNLEDEPLNPATNPDAVANVCVAPTAIISNNSSVCLGQPATLHLEFTGTAPWNYTISNGSQTVSGSSSVALTDIAITPSSAGTHIYTITSISNTGCAGSGSGSATVVVSTLAPTSSVIVPPIVNLPAYACNGTNVSNINVPSVANATQYIWDGPLGTTFNGNSSPYISNSPSINISFGSLPTGASGYYIGVQAANACGVSLRKVQWVRGIVSVPSAIITANNRTTECANTNANYSIASVGGATSYLWSITGDATVSGTGTTVTVNFGPTWTGGTLSVSAQTPCYTSPAKTIVLTTAAPPLGVMSGVFSTCVGSTQTYSVPAAAGVTSYTWSLPQNTYGSSAGNAINVAINNGFTGGNISVTATSICGVVTAPRIKTIISGAPPTPSLISGFSNGICNTVVSYSCPPQPGVTFIWSSSVGTIQSGQGTNSVSISLGSFTTGTVSVVSSNACGSSSTRTISIKGAPNTPAAITANPAVWCNNDAGVQFNSSLSVISGAYTLNWAVIPASAATYVLGQGTNSYTVDWNSGNATISLTATNVCGSGTRTYSALPSCRGTGYEMTTNAEMGILVYPNPANEMVNVEFNEAGNDETQLIMLDLAGKKVAEQTLQTQKGNNKTIIDVSKLAKGIYLITLRSNSINEQIKITLQ
jgi:hypothetical protein